MIFDAQALFSDAQAITATAASENVIDLGTPGTPMHAAAPITQDLGRSEAPLRIQVVEDFDNLTSLTIALQTDAGSGFGSPKTVSTVTVALADLVAGKVVAPEYVPRGTDERFMRLYYTVTGTAPTAGKITAGLVFGSEAWSV